MRALLTLAALLVLTACAPASIGSYPDEEGEVKLPRRSNSSSNDEDAGTNTTGDPGSSTPAKPTLTVTLAGTGKGSIGSTPGGLTCDATTCKGTFPAGTAVTLLPTATAGSLFGGWKGACTGTASCAPVMNGDVNLTADFQTLDGNWSGTYTNTRDASGCTFTNAGNLTATLKTEAAALSTTASVTGLELRFIPSCELAGKTTGTAPASNITVNAGTMTGTWTFNVQNANGTLAFPFTATLAGDKLTGTWTCATCKGSFTLTKQ